MGQAIQQLLSLFSKHRHDLRLHQGAHRLNTQIVFAGFSEGSLHQFLDEQTVHFTAAQEAFGRVDDAVDQGAIRL